MHFCIRLQVVHYTVEMLAGGIVERIAQWTGCAISLILWATLDSDLNNALWWAAKMDAHQIAGTVRPEKVALCLGWSGFVVVLANYRYRVHVRAISALVVAVLAVQFLFGLLAVKIFLIPGFHVITTNLAAAVAFGLAPILISAAMAYLLVTGQLFARITERIATAATLGLSATMIWIGAIDLIHPAITWR
jgi:hypothetical protein